MSRKKQTLRERTQWVALCGLLVALMLVLGFVEDVYKRQVTRLAAIQLVMMQASTSLMLSSDLSMPGMAPHSAPASMPPKKARNQMI